MHELNQQWMAYIDTEARAACEKKGWGSQVRRKWAVRETPVSESSVEDYEWKLIPGADGALPEQALDENDDGTYYLVSLDLRGERFLFQHDTVHAAVEPAFNLKTWTEIGFGRARDDASGIPSPPARGWLRLYLVELTSRFRPNVFSVT